MLYLTLQGFVSKLSKKEFAPKEYHVICPLTQFNLPSYSPNQLPGTYTSTRITFFNQARSILYNIFFNPRPRVSKAIFSSNLKDDGLGKRANLKMALLGIELFLLSNLLLYAIDPI